MRIVELIAAELAAAGVRRMFGLPGGGSNLDLIEAGARAGIGFILTHTEGAAAFMAAAEGELAGRPGICIATLGPGVASMANGLGHALLDRAPLLLFSDRHDDAVLARSEHQTLDHLALLRPVTKWSTVLAPATAAASLRAALHLSLEGPPGPVHLDLSTAAGQAQAPPFEAASPLGRLETALDGRLLERAKTMLAPARRPALLVGLAARAVATARAVRAFAERFGLPVLSSYKGKGVFPERHPLAAGTLTNGVIEDAILGDADALIAVGLDPVELLPRPWRWHQPLVAIDPWSMDRRQVVPAVELRGDPAAWLDALGKALGGEFGAGWSEAEIGARRQAMERPLMVPAGTGLTPWRVVQLARAAAAVGTIAAVDAGAHMFPATAFWPAEEPRHFLISSGQATMGYALPAAIAASLVAPEKPVFCFTGDGGLAINVAELETAARLHSRVVVVVFDDAALSLIKIKQELKGAPARGSEFGRVRWDAVAEGFGVPATRACSERELEAALAQAIAAPGPMLIDAIVDPRTYLPTLRAIRG